MSKIAIVTGGASGIGLSVAQALASRTDETWIVYTLDINAPSSTTSTPTSTEPEINHLLIDITSYTNLSQAIQKIYTEHKRLDFIFANAGTFIRPTFNDDIGFEAAREGDGPPAPSAEFEVLRVSMDAVIQTVWLGLFYFKLTRDALGDGWEGNVVVTSSIAGLYPEFAAPVYAAAKAGVLNFARSIAPKIKRVHNVRINVLCPALVQTGMTAGLPIPEALVTPHQKIVDAVLMFVDGMTGVDADGVEVKGEDMTGRAVEVSQGWFRFHEPPPYSDLVIERLMTWGK